MLRTAPFLAPPHNTGTPVPGPLPAHLRPFSLPCDHLSSPCAFMRSLLLSSSCRHPCTNNLLATCCPSALSIQLLLPVSSLYSTPAARQLSLFNSCCCQLSLFNSCCLSPSPLDASSLFPLFSALPQPLDPLQAQDVTSDDHPLSLSQSSMWNTYFQVWESVECRITGSHLCSDACVQMLGSGCCIPNECPMVLLTRGHRLLLCLKQHSEDGQKFIKHALSTAVGKHCLHTIAGKL